MCIPDPEHGIATPPQGGRVERWHITLQRSPVIVGEDGRRIDKLQAVEHHNALAELCEGLQANLLRSKLECVDLHAASISMGTEITTLRERCERAEADATKWKAERDVLHNAQGWPMERARLLMIQREADAEIERLRAELELERGEVKALEDGTGLTNVREQLEAQRDVEQRARERAEEHAALAEKEIDRLRGEVERLQAELERLKGEGKLTPAIWKSMSLDARAAYASRNDLLWRLIAAVTGAPGSGFSVDEEAERAIANLRAAQGEVVVTGEIDSVGVVGSKGFLAIEFNGDASPISPGQRVKVILADEVES
jgi:chromosome segregation ATPase